MLRLMNVDAEPKLAPPGAGLPQIELRVARMLFAFRFWTGSRESFHAAFQAEREKISQLLTLCDGQRAAQRVLIKRLSGLEDSSRYWSVYMTLDHLRIVHTNIAGTILALSKGMVPKRVANTANVKPSPDIGESIVAEYEKSCDAVIDAAAKVSNLNTSARYAHPWFGPLNAAGWHALAATHLAIHRRQIERITQVLTR